MREELGSIRDSAPSFIKAYALSGARVDFSCPEKGFAGEEAVHGFLASISDGEAPGKEPDRSYAEEASWLSGRGPRPSRLHRTQSLGLRALVSASAFAPGNGASLEAGTAALAAARLTRRGKGGAESRPGIDSTAIDYYLSCPYSYLYLRLLDAGPSSSGISFVDALFIGDVYHETLARLFARIRDADGRFRPERSAEYRSLVGPCLDEAFAELAQKRGTFVGVVLEAYRGRLASHIENLVEAEARLFPDLEVGPIEAELVLEYPDVAGGVLLRGRIDRISRSARGAVVVDYKKGVLPSKSQVAPDEAGAIAEAQVPCYLRLVAANSGGEAIDSAWYISIEGDSRREAGYAACAFGDATSFGLAEGSGDGPYVPRSSLESFLEAFDAALRKTVEGIFAGEIPLAPKDTQKTACASCGARGICRERYSLRFGEGA